MTAFAHKTSGLHIAIDYATGSDGTVMHLSINMPKLLEEAKRLSEIKLIPGNTYNLDVLDKIALAKALIMCQAEIKAKDTEKNDLHAAIKDIARLFEVPGWEEMGYDGITISIEDFEERAKELKAKDAALERTAAEKEAYARQKVADALMAFVAADDINTVQAENMLNYLFPPSR